MPFLALTLIIVTLCFMVGMIIWGVRKYQNNTSESQRVLTDRELLLLINSESDRIISPAILAKKSGLSLQQAKSRLHKMMYDGLVNQMNAGFKYFYELKNPINKENTITLSDKPF